MEVRTVTRRESDEDGIAVARLHDAVYYTRSHHMTPDQAIAHLHEITTRPDLLAHTAGIIAGAGKANTMAHWPWALEDARLLIAARADRELLPHWIKQGIENIEGSKWRTDASQRDKPQGVYHAPDELVQAVLAEVLDGMTDAG